MYLYKDLVYLNMWFPDQSRLYPMNVLDLPYIERVTIIPELLNFIDAPKVLVLCAVYSSVCTSLDRIETDTEGILSERFRRDLYRCLATEALAKVKVYTVDKLPVDNGSYPRKDRHFSENINSLSRMGFTSCLMLKTKVRTKK
jgi:hypothetical protein